MDLTAEQETAPSMAERAPRRGIGYALLAALLFGVSTPLAKGLLIGLSPQVLAGLLYLGSGLGLGALWLIRRRAGRVAEAALSRRDLSPGWSARSALAACSARCCCWSASHTPLPPPPPCCSTSREC